MNNKSYTALIIDDERKGREVLINLLAEYCPHIVITGEAGDVEAAFSLINDKHPDVVFLDIQMPGGSGFNLLEKFEQIKFQIIFTTSFDQYAIKAIRMSALDYLLKPINIDELVAAVGKLGIVDQNIETLNDQLNIIRLKQQNQGKMEKLALPTQQGFHFLNIGDIEYCEASSNYTYIHLKNKNSILASRTLKDFNELLEDEGFCRIHQSYLINMKYIKKYLKSSSSVLMENGKELSVSVRKKDEFMEKLRTL
jgi:two-component system LytT family response regulator